MLILTQHLAQADTPFPDVREHFVEPERIRFFAENDGSTTVITHDGSALFYIQEEPMTIARMRAAWELRHETHSAQEGDLPIAARAKDDGDVTFVACRFVAERRTRAKVAAMREMADDLNERAGEAESLASKSEAALAAFTKVE
jgi:hypothetical protein